jgi:tetratricopeptide (TPR) repeat protein
MLKKRTLNVFLIFIFLSQYSLCQEIETINRYRRSRLADEYYEKAMRFYERNHLSEAIDHFETSVSLDPKNYLAYFFLGSSYEKSGYLEKALLNYNLSLALKPDFSEGLFSRAILYHNTSRYEKAVEDFNHLLELPESETQVIYFRGIKFGENDNDTGFDQLLTMSTRESDIHNFLGHCYSELKQPEWSVQHYTEAIRLSPGQDNNYVNRGMAYLEWGKQDSAKKDFQTALDINPQNVLARYNFTLLEEEDEVESLDRINELIKRNPRLSFAYASRAYYYFQHGDYMLARIDYDSAIHLEPENPSHYLNRGMCFEKMNNLENAYQDYKKATGLDPSDPRVWYNQGNIFYKQEKFKHAIESYTLSIQLDPNSGSYYYNRGLSYFQLDDRFNACKDMELAFQLNIEQAGNFLKKNCPKDNR